MKNLTKYFGFFGLFLLLCVTGCSKSEVEEAIQLPPNPEGVDPLPSHMELAPSAVQLNHAQLAFLAGVDEENTTLSFAASLPSEYLPREGQILVQLTPTEALPYGFVGRVTKVAEGADGYVVYTEAPSLTEIFDKLQTEGEAEVASVSRAIPTDEDGFYVIEHNYDLANKSLKNRGIQLKGAYNTGFRPYSSFDIDNKGGRDDVLFKFDTKNETALTVILSPELEFDEVCDLGKGALLSLTMGNLPIAVFLQPYFTISGAASAGANVGVTLNEYNTYQVAKKGILPKITRLKESFELELLSDLSSKISGEFFAGLGLRVDFRVFGRKDLSVGVGPEVGFHAAGEVGAYLIEGNEVSTSDYEALEENHVALSGKAQLSGYVDATFFKEVKEPWHETLAEFIFFQQCYYLLPSFYNTRYESDGGRIEARTTVGRDLLFETKVGIAAYRDGRAQHYGEGYTYHFYEDFQSKNPICAQFTEEPGVEYWTYIKLGNDYVRGVRCEDDDLRKRLIKLYQDTDGDNWRNNEGWCTDRPIDEWYGVEIVRDSLGVAQLDLLLHGNNLTGEADLSGCDALRSATFLVDNPLVSVNLSDCRNFTGYYYLSELRGIILSEESVLEKLDVSGCTSLEFVQFYDIEHLTSLDVSGCTSLKMLHGGACPSLSSLDLSGCTSLRYLECGNSSLSSLDVSECVSLQELRWGNSLCASLDLSGCETLEVMYCWDNVHLTSLNLSRCTSLTDINFAHNPQLTTINLSGCTALTEFDHGVIHFNQQLETLNLSGCTALRSVNVSSLANWNTQLTSLDVSGCTALYSLGCSDNQLTSLNAEGCTALRSLNCRDNPMTQMISAFYQSIPSFSCDKRYTYFTREVKIGDEYITRYYWKYNYADHHGWYYPDEPKAGYMYAGN